MKKKYKLVILIIIVIAEIFYLLYSISGVLLFIDRPSLGIFRFTVALSLHAAWLLCISIGGIIRWKKRENFSLIKNILMLPIATVITLGVGYLTVYDLADSYMPGIACLIVGLMLTGLMHLHKPVKATFVILIIIVTAEILYLLDSINGVIFYLDRPDLQIFRFSVASALHAVWLLCISIGGIIRWKKREKFSLVKNILMLPIASVIALGISYFVAFDFEDSYIAGIIFLVIGLILAGLMHLHRPDKSSKTEIYYTPPKFEYIRSEWYYDEAALEYCNIHNKTVEELSEEEEEKIFGYAENWLLYFIAWLVKHNFFVYTDEEIMRKEHEEEIISETCSPSRLFSNIDNSLNLDHIAPELYDFMTLYFKYHTSIGNYWDDYISVIHKFGSYDYCVEFSWDIYHEIEKLIDAAYRENTLHSELEEDDDIEELDNIRCDWLNADITVRKSKDVTEEYAKRCIEHFLSFSPEMRQKLCDTINDAFPDWLLLLNTKNESSDIITCSHFDSIMIFKPYGDEPAYTIGGEPDFEEEHGIGVVIRGDKVLDAGYRSDIEYASPWLKEYVEEYNKQ